MRADAHAVLLGQALGFAHDGRIGGMKAAGHIGDRYERHNGGVVAAFIDAVGFAHIAIEVDGHRRLSS